MAEAETLAGRLNCAIAVEAREFHRAVVHFAEPQRQRVERVILVKLPRFLGALLRQNRAGPLKISGREIHHRLFDDVRVAPARNAAANPFSSM